MIDYKALYHFLFNGITDIISEAELPENQNNTEEIVNLLKLLQIGAEEQYLNMGDE